MEPLLFCCFCLFGLVGIPAPVQAQTGLVVSAEREFPAPPADVELRCLAGQRAVSPAFHFLLSYSCNASS